MAPVSASELKLILPTDKPDAFYEYVDGQWKETPPMGALASVLASVLDRRLGVYGEQQKLGLSMTETLFMLSPKGPALRPDVAFVRYERWPYTTALIDDPPAFPLVPNLAVEVNSPSNTLDGVFEKAKDYFFAEAELVWVIMPAHRSVIVFDSPEQIRMLTDKQELDGGKVLPGFKLPLGAFFDSIIRPA